MNLTLSLLLNGQNYLLFVNIHHLLSEDSATLLLNPHFYIPRVLHLSIHKTTCKPSYLRRAASPIRRLRDLWEWCLSGREELLVLIQSIALCSRLYLLLRHLHKHHARSTCPSWLITWSSWCLQPVRRLRHRGVILFGPKPGAFLVQQVLCHNRWLLRAHFIEIWRWINPWLSYCT